MPKRPTQPWRRNAGKKAWRQYAEELEDYNVDKDASKLHRWINSPKNPGYHARRLKWLDGGTTAVMTPRMDVRFIIALKCLSQLYNMHHGTLITQLITMYVPDDVWREMTEAADAIIETHTRPGESPVPLRKPETVEEPQPEE